MAHDDAEQRSISSESTLSVAGSMDKVAEAPLSASAPAPAPVSAEVVKRADEPRPVEKVKGHARESVSASSLSQCGDLTRLGSLTFLT